MSTLNFCRLTLITVLLTTIRVFGEFNDSTGLQLQSGKYTVNYDGFLSSSFFLSNNRIPKDISGFTIFESLNITLTKSKKNLNCIHEFRNELSFFKYTDSIWFKNKDNLFISFQWVIESENKVKNSFLINIKTQTANSWEYSYNTKSGTQNKRWTSGPMMPLMILAGYGINRKYLKNSYLNISFGTLKVNLIPKNDRLSPEIKIQWETGNTIINSEYGFNIQNSLKASLIKIFTIENKTSFFTTGIDIQKMIFDIQNKISVKLNRTIKIRFENRFIYDYNISKRGQSRYELLIGFAFEN